MVTVPGTLRAMCGTLIRSSRVSALWMTFTIFISIGRMTRSLRRDLSSISSKGI